jgi:hypothetical protein
MPSLKSLASALQSKFPSKTASAYLIELDKKTDAPVKGSNDGSPYVAFQYWPETIQDGKAINYQQKEVPGGSLPLYQWVSSGERLISFTAVFTCDVDYGAVPAGPDDPVNSSSLAISAAGTALAERLKSAGQIRRNPDVRGAIAWLRRYMLPTYDSGVNGSPREPITRAPNKLRLYMPNSGIGVLGGSDTAGGSIDSVCCVMTQCEAAYEAYFPSGLLRVATVALAFAQIPQFRGGVFFPSANRDSGIQNLAGAYTSQASFKKG